MEQLINKVGSVEDIKCSLKFIDPKTADKKTLEMLEKSLKNEKSGIIIRASVIKILESKIRQIQKHNVQR